MVQVVESDEENMLEDMFFPTSASATMSSESRGSGAQNRSKGQAQKRENSFAEEAKNAMEIDSDDEASDESEEECDPNGDVAICDACNKVMPLSKYEKHISFCCQK